MTEVTSSAEHTVLFLARVCASTRSRTEKQHLGFHSRFRYSSYNSNRIVLCLFIISRNSSNFCTSYKLAEAGALFLLKFFKWMI